MKKNLFILTLSCISVFSLTGCGQTESVSEKTSTIVLNFNKKSLLPGESFQLNVDFSDVKGTNEVSYEASNDVVEVSESGLVTAKKIGESIITVTSGSATATCKVDVSLGDQTATIKLPGVSDWNVAVDVLDSFQFSPVVSYNGMNHEFDPIFEVEDTSVGTMEGNVFKPLAVGETDVIINGSFYGQELLTQYCHVQVKEDVVFTVCDKEDAGHSFDKIDLYTASSFRGKDYLNSVSIDISLKVGGVDKSEEVVYSIVNDGSAINFDEENMKITAKNAGVATLKLSYLNYTKDIKITVNPVIGNFEGKPFVIDASEGTLPTEDIFAEFESDKTIVKATSVDGSKEYEVIDGKVYGIKSHNFAEQSIIVYNSQVGMTVTFRAYAKIIRTAADLNEFIIDFGQGSAAVEQVKNFQNDGYYIVENDIDCSGVTYKNQTRVLGSSSNYFQGTAGFMGTFDGQGHVISNMKAPKGGLFLLLGNGAIVRNVAFKDVVLDTSSDNDKFTLCTYGYAASISNVYINSSSPINSVNNALVAANMNGSCTISNSMFVFTGSLKSGIETSYGSFTHLCESTPNPANFLVNCYVVSPLAMTRATTYYADSRVYEQFGDITRKEYPNVKHYLSFEEMGEADQSYGSFDPTYWAVEDGILHFLGI